MPGEDAQADDEKAAETPIDAGVIRSTFNDDDSLESRSMPREPSETGRMAGGEAIDLFAMRQASRAGDASGAAAARRRRYHPGLAMPRMPMPAFLTRRGPAAVMGLCLVLSVAAIVKREAVVRVVPQTAGLFAAMNLPVNLRGLVFDGIRSETTRDGEGRLLVVEGEIVNVAGRAVPVPPVVVNVRSRDGDTLYTWTTEPERAELGEGERLAFRARLASPPVDGQNVIVVFAKDGGATLADTSTR